MSLASQHSAHAAIHVRAMFLEAAVLLVFLEFLRQIQGENLHLLNIALKSTSQDGFALVAK